MRLTVTVISQSHIFKPYKSRSYACSSARAARKWKTPHGSEKMSEDTHEETTVKKAVIVVLISLTQEAENKTGKELETEIRKMLEEGLLRIPWVILENVVIVEE